jgi:hypothetical protein
MNPFKRLRLWWLEFRIRRGWLKMAMNPLLGYPRNEPCWCGSGRKAKVCCLPRQPRVIPANAAVLAAQYMTYIKLATATRS